MPGFGALGSFPLGGSPLTVAASSMTTSMVGTATLTGVPTASALLAPDNQKRLIYAAEISPWTLTQ